MTRRGFSDPLLPPSAEMRGAVAVAVFLGGDGGGNLRGTDIGINNGHCDGIGTGIDNENDRDNDDNTKLSTWTFKMCKKIMFVVSAPVSLSLPFGLGC